MRHPNDHFINFCYNLVTERLSAIFLQGKFGRTPIINSSEIQKENGVIEPICTPARRRQREIQLKTFAIQVASYSPRHFDPLLIPLIQGDFQSSFPLKGG
jgi:hypothetical protein